MLPSQIQMPPHHEMHISHHQLAQSHEQYLNVAPHTAHLRHPPQ